MKKYPVPSVLIRGIIQTAENESPGLLS